MRLLNSVRVTKVVRHILDHGIPPILRDSAWFMRPLFRYWFRGRGVHEAMTFKDLAYELPDAELLAVLGAIESRGDDRDADLGQAAFDAILDRIPQLPKGARVLDVGSGRGHLSRVLSEHGLAVTGIDLREPLAKNATFRFIRGDIGNGLPFSSSSFDLVISTHVMEHVKFPANLAHEMWRVTKDQVWMVVPKQRYSYFTPDLHLHFFPTRGSLISVMGRDPVECFETDGEWFYRGGK